MRQVVSLTLLNILISMMLHLFRIFLRVMKLGVRTRSALILNNNYVLSLRDPHQRFLFLYADIYDLAYISQVLIKQRYYSTLTLWRFDFFNLGKVNLRIPFLNLALVFSSSTSAGNDKVRE